MYPTCPITVSEQEAAMWVAGIKIFLVVWIVFVPIAITARLEQIIKILKEKK
ncbi:MAG: hypothetical protein KAJ18_05555 [Candidatus Omnitrophica bacterium]|nr:hypothetical protein [Candidatus Omnitrophota bacterium]